MALNQSRSWRSVIIAKEAVAVGQRTFAAGAGKAKKGSKGAAGDAPKASILSKEVKSLQWLVQIYSKMEPIQRSCPILSTLIGCGICLTNVQH
ncbi:hypothetical protein CRYUN_Cryun15aG0011800 [Craigia yunnanensis]